MVWTSRTITHKMHSSTVEYLLIIFFSQGNIKYRNIAADRNHAGSLREMLTVQSGNHVCSKAALNMILFARPAIALRLRSLLFAILAAERTAAQSMEMMCRGYSFMIFFKEKKKQFLGDGMSSTFSYRFVIRNPDITKKMDTPNVGQQIQKCACSKKIPKNASALRACKESILCPFCLSILVTCIALRHPLLENFFPACGMCRCHIAENTITHPDNQCAILHNTHSILFSTNVKRISARSTHCSGAVHLPGAENHGIITNYKISHQGEAHWKA